jgi:hypothetical protein
LHRISILLTIPHEAKHCQPICLEIIWYYEKKEQWLEAVFPLRLKSLYQDDGKPELWTRLELPLIIAGSAFISNSIVATEFQSKKTTKMPLPEGFPKGNQRTSQRNRYGLVEW